MPLDENERETALLRYYLKNDENMQWYADEIDELINKDRNLLILFHRELGKRNARDFAKTLRQKGLSKRWFAIYDDIIIASGADRKKVENNAKAILPPNDTEFIHFV
ncbi:MAG: hypothetical protein ACE5I8_09375, partial [Thermodesulfobacteriota bacterium]